MSYVKQVLQPNENVLANGDLHWMMYVGPAFGVLSGIIAFVVAAAMDQRGIAMGGFVLFVGGTFGLVKVWFDRWTTEVAVTNKRFIVKRGFIRRDTREMNLEKIETVEVHQTILGRLLGFGTVAVRGTGAGIEGIAFVSNPLQLRSAITAR